MRNNLQSWISLLTLIVFNLGYQLNAHAQERVLLDFKADSIPPKEWKTIGFAFGTHQPEPKERQKEAVAPRNQRYVGIGRMTSPSFVVDSDYLHVTCAGTFDPVRVAVVLIVDGKDVRSCSPEPGYGFLGYQLHKKEIKFFQNYHKFFIFT